jgi:hypothetical protein
MKTIKVFVSSPGDVQAERTIADRLIRATAEELGIPISVQYSNLLRDRAPDESQTGNQGALKSFKTNIDGNIDKADENWRQLAGP